MCLILFAYKVHPRYPLILIANRDEHYDRPTQSLHWWAQEQGILAGRDLESGGTWMGVNRIGRIAAVTNVRNGIPTPGHFKSRGELTAAYLTDQQGDHPFAEKLKASASSYRGYNLLFGSIIRLFYFSNLKGKLEEIQPGIHGLSNAEFNTPWPKVTRGKKKLAKKLSETDPDPQSLLDILSDRTIPPDDQLPDSGVGLEAERLLSSMMISGANYGTRCSSVILIDNQKQFSVYEQERAPQEGPLKKVTFRAN